MVLVVIPAESGIQRKGLARQAYHSHYFSSWGRKGNDQRVEEDKNDLVLTEPFSVVQMIETVREQLQKVTIWRNTASFASPPLLSARVGSRSSVPPYPGGW